MAAFTPGTVPSHINTYERLAVWAAQVIQDISGPQEVRVVENEPAYPRASVSVSKTADGRAHFICSLFVPCNEAELNSPTEKTWMAAEDINTTAPHVNLLDN